MKIAVFGAGTMGSGIAQVFAGKGHTVLLYASSTASAQRHKDKLAASLNKRVAKGKMTQEAADDLMSRVLVEEFEAAADADLVIECVAENMAVKKELLGRLDALCKDEAIFASNTSSLSITEMGQGLKHHLIGMHFFNPVPAMKLVEVIAGGNTPAELVDYIKNLSTERASKRSLWRSARPPWWSTRPPALWSTRSLSPIATKAFAFCRRALPLRKISILPCSWAATTPWVPCIWVTSLAGTWC